VKLTRSQQKALKTVHRIAAGLWLANVIVLMCLPAVTQQISSGDALYMYNVVYHFIDFYLLTPAAVITLFSGLFYSLLTPWGFFDHGWLIYKWLTTLVIVITGTIYLGPLVTDLLIIADGKRLHALHDPYYLQGQQISFYAAIVNTILLTLAVVFSIYKPWKKQAKAKGQQSIPDSY
jgi:hypothetical protein